MAEPHTAGERKQVTVLFADVVGSMRLAAQLDSERFQELMNELFNRAAAVVQRYQGTVDKFTGDGLMAVFGAPFALEDHALRACIAASEIQSVTQRFAADVRRRDGISLELRIGVNSGEVIAGHIGSGPGRYTAVGHSVGMAQRMESAAAPNSVLCSESTAHLVEHKVQLGPVEKVAVKGLDEHVAARRLITAAPAKAIVGRNESVLLGRDHEMRFLRDRFTADRGGLVAVMGAPGLGKSRLTDEFTAAVESDADIVIARCEAHTTNHAFRALSRLLRELFAVTGLADEDARARTAVQCPGLDPRSADAQILFEVMGIAQKASPDTQTNIDGRRRRLVELTTRALRRRPRRIVLVVEDVHWIDAPSDAVLAECAALLAQSPALFLTTFRPEFHGELRRAAAEVIALQPLTDAMLVQLAHLILGQNPTTQQLTNKLTAAAAGNPFYLEEIIRDLADRGILSGVRGDYRLARPIGEIAVPATVQAVLAARIDRLPPATKSVLNAAAVVGTRFDLDALTSLLCEPVPARLAELVSAELIDQTHFVPHQRYCFRHPLVRTVAYESQLSTTRSRMHRKVAAAIRARNPAGEDENAAQIATHLEAAGDLTDAYHWHLRAAEWLRSRDLPAARNHWAHAESIADRLPDDHPGVVPMRIVPRTMLVSTLLYVGADPDADTRYRRLRELTSAGGDLTSLAVATAGRIWAFALNDHRVPEAVTLADELTEHLGELTCDASATGIILNAVAFARFADCDFAAALAAIDAIETVPGGVPMIELAPAIMMKGVIDILCGRSDSGQRYLRDGMRRARELPPVNRAAVLALPSFLVALGLCDVDDIVDEMREGVRRAEEVGDILAMVAAHFGYGAAGLRSASVPRCEAITSLRTAAEAIDKHRVSVLMGVAVAADLSRESARSGDADGVVERLWRTVDQVTHGGSRLLAGLPVEALVELLLERDFAGDRAEARRLVDEWKTRRVGIPGVDLWWLRARALLARTDGDAGDYVEAARQYLTACQDVGAHGRLAGARRLVDAGMDGR
ncbi:adenylate/guanylate cyclase domain-containing protein [Mycobacterium sp. PS03-16]|uniref:ATP-binding protein n=1 Tax=Mycobacterium sp. PS03-16 TaxID=2559611 RepID=UPI001FD848DC|nr:adenylate/guanylate cyclase domain-containing protein [Mycobacterium sp. PS03-16]